MPNRYWTSHPERKMGGPKKGPGGPGAGKAASVNVTHPKWGKGVPKVKCHAKSSLY